MDEKVDMFESDPDLIDDSDLDDNHLCNMYNFGLDQQDHEQTYELEKEKQSEDVLDDQDIDDQDREVLNDRILGIINIFQHIV